MIKKLIKRILFFLSAAALALALSILWYWNSSFRPHLPNIRSTILNTSEQHKNLPTRVKKIIISTNRSYKVHVSKGLFWRFKNKSKNILQWHIKNILWLSFIKLHFSDEELLVLWCHFAPFMKEDRNIERGLNNSALFHFKKKIKELNNRELLTIIEITKNPARYLKNQEKLEKRVDSLMDKYQSEIETQKP
ncbi:MAG: hypothetical protein D6B27_02050 [Gammaproteobacteria bacterium]|nr:MAG: hypothetical protein D6B27_02050 [Gammaproteobacteria bacterium]